MADAKTHALIAGVAGVAAYAVYCHRNALEVRFLDAVVSGWVAVVGGLAPDLIEPANNPNHRSLFHSLAAGAALIQGTNQVQANDRIPDNAKLIMFLLVVGYVSHLLVDAITPKGLPVFC
jgi:inner membrane protein